MSGTEGAAAPVEKPTPMEVDKVSEKVEGAAVGEKRTADESRGGGDSGHGKKRRKMDVEALLKDDALSFTIFGIKPRLKEKQLKAVLDAVPGVEYEKLKKAANIKVAKIRFASAEQKEKSLRAMVDVEIDGKPIMVGIPAAGKRKQPKPDEMAKPKTVVDATTPWWNMPYEEQIQKKAQHVESVLRKITLQTRRDSSNKEPAWLRELPERNSPCCTFEGVRESPIKEAYRNKVEFTVGYNKEDKPTVGFLLGRFVDGRTDVGEPSTCKNVSAAALRIQQLVQQVVESSNLPPYQKTTSSGFWRLVGVKTFRTGEGLVSVQVCTSDLGQEVIDEQKKKLVDLFEEHQVKESLFWQEWNGVSNFADTSVAPLILLRGSGYAHETLEDLKFRISPSAFFQVNTPGAELLYSIVREWCAAGEDATVVDVCCGTGTIGLSMAGKVKNVIGIEMEESAVEDAKVNAQLNNINNAIFVAGKAEDVTNDTLAEHATENCVAVVDPPRGGLHPSVVRTIRACPHINRLVYVSCDQGPLVGNASGFCRAQSNKLRGAPFKPIKAVAVDMFPLTPKVEVVVLFEREKTDPAAEKKAAIEKNDDRFQQLLAKQKARLAAIAAEQDP